MNTKVKKALFILTFLPYALVVLGGLKGAFFGATFFGTDYGLDGFITGVFISLFCMIAFIPVIPVCIVFHLLCLLRKTEKISTKKFTVICLVLCAIAAAVPIVKIYF